MKALPIGIALLALALVGSVQEKAGGRVAVLNLREAMDKANNLWMADIEVELQKQADADAGRATDLNPNERQRIKTKQLDLSNKRRLEVYAELVRLSGAIAKSRGFDVVQRVDRMPVLEGGDADLLLQIERRGVIAHDPSVDLTQAVLAQLNGDYANRKR